MINSIRQTPVLSIQNLKLVGVSGCAAQGEGLMGSPETTRSVEIRLPALENLIFKYFSQLRSATEENALESYAKKK